MDNKNGFTLIELLAIIVILAIIAVITVPIILGIIDDSSKGAAVNSAYGFRDAVQNYYAYKSLQDSQSELPNGIVMALNLPSDFSASGELPSDGWVNLTNGNVTEFSLKFGEYVVTKLGDEDVVSEKNDYVVYNIPEEYQRVEYLQSNGSQYIDTGTYLLDGEKASIKFSLNDYKDYQVIFGQTSTGFGSLQARPKFNWYYKTSGISVDPILNKLYTCTAGFNGDKGEVNLDGQTGVFDVSEDNTNMLIFSRQNTSGYEMNGKVYSFGMGVRRSLVPVVRKSDNKPGMLDMANYSRNLLKLSSGSYDVRGVAVQISDDGQITMSGTAIASGGRTIKLSPVFELKAGEYVLSNDNPNSQAQIWLNNAATNNYINHHNVFLEDTSVFFGINVVEGATYNESFNVMLNAGDEPLPYEPYRGKSFYTNEGTGEFTAGPEL